LSFTQDEPVIPGVIETCHLSLWLMSGAQGRRAGLGLDGQRALSPLL